MNPINPVIDRIDSQELPGSTTPLPEIASSSGSIWANPIPIRGFEENSEILAANLFSLELIIPPEAILFSNLVVTPINELFHIGKEMLAIKIININVLRNFLIDCVYKYNTDIIPVVVASRAPREAENKTAPRHVIHIIQNSSLFLNRATVSMVIVAKLLIMPNVIDWYVMPPKPPAILSSPDSEYMKLIPRKKQINDIIEIIIDREAIAENVLILKEIKRSFRNKEDVDNITKENRHNLPHGLNIWLGLDNASAIKIYVKNAKYIGLIFAL